jgi:SAM-dependent methyltransferase
VTTGLDDEHRPISYRINEDESQVRQEQERLLVLAEVFDPNTRTTLLEIGLGPGWSCCDVGSGAGTIVEWMADRVGPTGRVVSIDVDTRFQPPSREHVDVRVVDVTAEPIGDREFDVVHARGVLQHLVEREAVLDKMIAAAKPGGWVVVQDSDWVQFDEQPIPEPFATLSRTLRELSAAQHGHDATWGRYMLDALARRGLVDVEVRGRIFTMHGGTASAEWYVGGLARAIDVVPPAVFPPGFAPADAIAQARDPRFMILSPISLTARGRIPS